MTESCDSIKNCEEKIKSHEAFLKKAATGDDITDEEKRDIIDALTTLKTELKQKHFNNIMNHIIDKGQYACNKSMTKTIIDSTLRKITLGRKKISPCNTIDPNSDILLCRFEHDETTHKAMSNKNFNTYIKELFDSHFDAWMNTLDEKKKECVNENKTIRLIRHMYEGAMISVFFFSYNNKDEDLLQDYKALFPIDLADSLGMTFQKPTRGGKTSRKKSTKKRKQRKSKKSRSKKI